MSTREHAVDPSTLAQKLHDLTCSTRDVPWSECPYDGGLAFDEWARFVADECPPAEQWRQVTPEEVREGWLVRLVAPGGGAFEGRFEDGFIRIGYIKGESLSGYSQPLRRAGWTLWTNEPADPDAERRRLIEAATGRNAETLEANLAEYGLAIVEVAK